MIIDDLIKNLKSINIEEIVIDSVEKNEKKLHAINISNLEKGKLSTGQSISPKYATKSYTKFKKKIGSKSAPTPDLKVTEKLYNGINYKKKSKTSVEIESSVDYAKYNEDRYSEDIYGAGINETIEVIKEDVQKELINKILK